MNPTLKKHLFLQKMRNLNILMADFFLPDNYKIWDLKAIDNETPYTVLGPNMYEYLLLSFPKIEENVIMAGLMTTIELGIDKSQSLIK